VARKRITEQDDRFVENKEKAEKDPAGMAALVIINLEDLADANDEIKDKLDEHCAQPADKAHPAPSAPPAGADPTAGLTPGQKYKLAVMENRGKIIAGVFAAILAAITLAIKGG
jgi:hypothetical protein